MVTASAGGIFGSSTLNVTANNTWNAAGSLNVARAGHTAALLPNGKVLVNDGIASFSSIEIYDPVSDTWSPAGSLHDNTLGMNGRTLTLLNNGRVLFAGGMNHLAACFATAQLYDPTAQTVVSTGSMALRRSGHTATLLKTGNVLVAGGACFPSGQASEVFDSGTGAWSATTGNMLYPGERYLVGRGNHDLSASRAFRKLVTRRPGARYRRIGGQWRRRRHRSCDQRDLRS
jgi:hypothetical protein